MQGPPQPRLVIITTPTLDTIIHVDGRIEERPGGPGIYAGKAAAEQGAQAVVLGGIDYRDYPIIKKAHEKLGVKLEAEHTNCTQGYTLIYSPRGWRIAVANNKCPPSRDSLRLLWRTLHHAHQAPRTVILWAPLWGALDEHHLILQLLLKHTPIPLAIDLQYIARGGPQTLTSFQHHTSKTPKSIWIAHADRQEAQTVCRTPTLDPQTLQACRKRLNIQELLVSNGPQPVQLATPEGTLETPPLQIVENPDPTGAGEVLLSTYIIQRIQGNPPEKALKAAVTNATRHVQNQSKYNLNKPVQGQNKH